MLFNTVRFSYTASPSAARANRVQTPLHVSFGTTNTLKERYDAAWETLNTALKGKEYSFGSHYTLKENLLKYEFTYDDTLTLREYRNDSYTKYVDTSLVHEDDWATYYTNGNADKSSCHPKITLMSTDEVIKIICDAFKEALETKRNNTIPNDVIMAMEALANLAPI